MTFYLAFYIDAFDIKSDHSEHGVLFTFVLTAFVYPGDTHFSFFSFIHSSFLQQVTRPHGAWPDVERVCVKHPSVDLDYCLLAAIGRRERKRKKNVWPAVREPARLHKGVVWRRRVEAGARARRRPASLFRHTPGERLNGHLCPPSPCIWSSLS